MAATSDVFQFTFSSADVKPGKGAGESVADPSLYTELAKKKNWRRQLSNFAEAEFKWKGLTWKTAEHAYQAAKFEQISPETFRSFALESGSALSKGTGPDAQKERKIIKLSKAQIAEWDARKQGILRAIWRAKFTQHEPSREILLLTGNAQLFHRAPRTELQHWTDLEALRAELRGGAEEDENGEEEEEEEENENASEDSDEEADTPAAAAPAEPPPVNSPVPKLPTLPLAPSLKKTTVTNADATRPTAVTAAPPALTTNGVVDAPPEEPPAEEKKHSTLRFCPTCRAYLFLSSSPNSLVRLCRKCGYSEEDKRGGLVMEMRVQERSSEAYKILINEFTRQDPTLAHIRGPIKCPSAACETNTVGKERDVIPIRWDEKQLKYLYICNVCGFQWRSRD